MKHKLLIAAAATALMAAPSLASAQDDAGWYLKGAAGYGIGTDIDITGGIAGDAEAEGNVAGNIGCLLYTSPSPRDLSTSRMPSSA